MISKFIIWSINNRFLVLLFFTIISAYGMYAVKQTPVDAIPDLSDVQVIIKTTYSGQAPRVVEDQVTFPLTSAMLSVPKAKAVRGFSFYGDSYVYIIFEEGTDIYWARSRVLEYLNQASESLPPQAKPQLGPDASGVGWIYIYALKDTTGKHNLSQLRSIQDWFLKFELQSVAGVSEVASVGGMVKQYQIEVNPEKLRLYQIPLQHISNAIQQANQEVGASVIEMAEAEYMVRATGYLKSIKDIETIPLGLSQSNTPILLKDLATVTLGPEMRRGISELNGQGEATGGIVVMRHGENAAKTIERIKQKLEEVKASLPKGVEIIPVYDRSKLITSAIDNLWEKLTEELIMVALVCMVFLFHMRSSLVAIISLPLGILTAYIVIYWQGLNANIMSLGGIAIAIGAMIDGAIVMIENMHKHLEQQQETGKSLTSTQHWEIVKKASTEVGPALFFSLLIITVSFIPVFTLEAQEGRMFSPLAFTKTYAMAASAALAISLIPILMGYFIRGKIRKENENPINRILINSYRPLLKWALLNPKTTLLATGIFLLSCLYPLNKLGSEFMPSLDEGDLMYMPTTYPALSIGKARELLQQTDKLIMTLPEVESVFGKIGRAETATDPAPLTMIESFIQLKPQSQWRDGMTSKKIQEELNQLIKFPGLTNAWVMPIKTRIDMLATGIKTPVGIKVAGEDLATIENIGIQLEKILTDVPGTASAYSERLMGGRYINLNIDRFTASRYGLSVQQIQQTISSAIGGKSITNTLEGLERYSINLRYPQSYRDSPESLRDLPIITDSGKQLTLGDVTHIVIEDGPTMIKSEGARPNGWTYIDVNLDKTNIAEYVDLAKQAINQQLDLPSGYSLNWAGQYEYMVRAKERLSLLIPLTLAIIVILLFINFKRATPVIVLLASLPLAVVGSLWLMWGLGYNNSIASYVGMIALAGVAVETSVLMWTYLDHAWENLSQDKHANRNNILESVLNGATLRVRPVIMTAGATIIGLFPILFASGTGSEIMSRLAAPMVGGMISSVLLTLLVLPVVYYLIKCREMK